MNPIRKTAGHLGRTSVGLAVLAILVIAGSVGHAAEGTAKVQQVRGGVCEFSTNGTTWERLRVGMVLKSGTWIRTDVSAIVDLFLKQNGPVVRLAPSGKLSLKTLRFEMRGNAEISLTTVLVLSQGSISGAVRVRSQDSCYRLETPTVVYLLSGANSARFGLSACGRQASFGDVLKAEYMSAGNGVSQDVSIPDRQVFDPAASNGRGGIVDLTPGEEPEAEVHFHPISNPENYVDVPTRGEGLGVDPAKVGFNGPFPKAPAK